jgi:hypothetical protein
MQSQLHVLLKIKPRFSGLFSNQEVELFTDVERNDSHRGE